MLQILSRTCSEIDIIIITTCLLSGSVSRHCNSYATYDPAVYECTSERISNISRKVRICNILHYLDVSSVLVLLFDGRQNVVLLYHYGR